MKTEIRKHYSILLSLFIDKLFHFFLAIGFLFLICMFAIAGIFLYNGISDLFVNKFSNNQVEISLFELIKGIEFIFIAGVPYLLMLSIHKYFKLMYPIVQKSDRSNLTEPNYESVQKTREEILFVRSLIVSIFIAVVTTHMISHILGAMIKGQIDLQLSGVSAALLIILIFYYAQIEKGLPPNVRNIDSKKE